MSISEKLKTIRSCQQAIRTAILGKGVSISGNLSTYADAINQLKNPTGSETITENGTYDVADDAEVIVDVEGGITPTGSIEITENGTYDVTEKATAVVNVESGGGIKKMFESVEISGTFWSTSCFDMTYGLKVGYTEDFEALISVKTNNSNYENVNWTKSSAPTGVTIDGRSPGSTMDSVGAQVCAVLGLDSTKSYALSIAVNSRNSSNDYVTVAITITEV